MTPIKAVFFNLDEAVPVPIFVMFNPQEYSLRKVNNSKENQVSIKELDALQFANREIEILELNLFFDTSDIDMDVQFFTQSIINLARIRKDKGRLPHLHFIWGTLVFSCVMTDAEQTFKGFNRFGLGIRAEVKVVLKGYNKSDAVLNKLYVNPVTNAFHALKTGRDFLLFAKEECDDEKNWRTVAKARKIINPLIF